jgi:hypothetical protein
MEGYLLFIYILGRIGGGGAELFLLYTFSAGWQNAELFF